MTYLFGTCTLDTDCRVLERNGTLVHLEPQVFHLLTHLLANSGRVVTKAELFDVIWGGRAVSDAVLTSRMRSLRRAIDEIGEPSLVRTLHRVGYRFQAKVICEGKPSTPALPSPNDAIRVEPPSASAAERKAATGSPHGGWDLRPQPTEPDTETAITDTKRTLRTVLEKNSDAALFREMIGAAAERLMVLEIEGRFGAGHGARYPRRLNHRGS